MYLFSSVYILERPDVGFNFMAKLWTTIQLLIQYRKEREKSELLNILSKKFSNLIYAYHLIYYIS